MFIYNYKYNIKSLFHDFNNHGDGESVVKRLYDFFFIYSGEKQFSCSDQYDPIQPTHWSIESRISHLLK